MRCFQTLSVLGLLLLASCGGSGNIRGQQAALELQPAEALPLVTPAGLARQLPAIPDDPQYNPSRIAAAAEVVLDGTAFHRSAGNTTPAGSGLQLDSSADLSWAIYRFVGVPGEQIDSLGFGGSNLSASGELFLAISDYQLNRWSFLPNAITDQSFTQGLSGSAPGRFVSALGNTYVLVVAGLGSSFTLSEVRLEYADRFIVSGRVADPSGIGVEGASVSALAGGAVLTDANGDYALTLPSGNWPVVAVKDGWTFFNRPAFVEVIDANTTVEDILGQRLGSNYIEPGGGSSGGSISRPQLWDPATPLQGSCSYVDDYQDYYRFTVSQPGSYLLRLNSADPMAFFPLLELFNPEGGFVDNSTVILQGAAYIGLVCHEGPRDFIAGVSFGLQRGGGHYELSLLEQDYAELSGTISDGVFPVRRVMLDVTAGSGGLLTTYLQSSSFLPGGRTFRDRFRPALSDSDVEPRQADYSFTPASQLVDLSGGAQTSVNFAATPDALPDSFEPNNSFAAAASLGALPYNAADPMTLGPGDAEDYYSFTPAAGKALRARVLFDKPDVGDDPVEFRLFNSMEVPVAFGSLATSGEEIRYSTTNGNQYVLRVSLGSARHLSYRLYVEEYDPVLVSAEVLLNGQAVPDASIWIYDSDFDYRVLMQTDDLGQISGIPAQAGEVFHVECLAHQLEVHRQTRTVTATAPGTKATFNASHQGQDSHEPNSANHSFGPSLSLPVQIDATVGNMALGDSSDYYQFDTSSTEPIRIEVSIASGGGPLYLDFFDSFFGYLGSRDVFDGDIVYFPSDGLNGQRITLYSSEDPLSYSLNISHSPAFLLEGDVFDDALNPLSALSYVFNATTNDYYFNNGGGVWAAQNLLPSGSYELWVVAPNFRPKGPYIAEVNGADLFFSITGLTYSNTEPDEPNNDQFTPASITLDTLLTDRVVGDQLASDFYDYYLFTAAAGQRLRVRVDASQPWEYMAFALLNDTAMEWYGSGVRDEQGQVVLDVIAPFSGDYLIELYGEGEYELIVQSYP